MNMDPDPIQIQDFDDQKLEKITKFFFIFKSKFAISKPMPLKKRTSSTSKHEISLLFPIFVAVGHFYPPGSGSGFRIHRAD
jgi:hypothetical protein